MAKGVYGDHGLACSEREVGIEICARETIIGHESLVLREIGPHTVSKPPNALDTEAVEKIWQDGCCTREAHVPAVHAKKTSGARQHGGAEVRVSPKAEGIPQGLQRDRGGTESEAFATAIAGANANGRRRERVWMDEARPRQENDAVRSGETSREDERGKPRCNFRVRASGLNTNENRSYFRQVGTKEAGAEANDNEGEAKGMGLEMGDATETGLEDKDNTRRGNAWPVFECRLASSIREGDSRTSGGRSNERREEGERESVCVCVYTHEGERECNRWGAIRHDGVAVVASFREREEAQALQRRDIVRNQKEKEKTYLDHWAEAQLVINYLFLLVARTVAAQDGGRNPPDKRAGLLDAQKHRVTEPRSEPPLPIQPWTSPIDHFCTPEGAVRGTAMSVREDITRMVIGPIKQKGCHCHCELSNAVAHIFMQMDLLRIQARRCRLSPVCGSHDGQRRRRWLEIEITKHAPFESARSRAYSHQNHLVILPKSIEPEKQQKKQYDRGFAC
ncbi:hypothetical protein EDB83DRAFT_2558021 [Lactarius deliciosus]|nr:hypothetical protein EDB83DRAFT_2558021 [Lactarius deliciosus]